jgi:oxepin-CoA hydrolase/3-oxo-5,6-dehydrosuberyl-CoA semialdehyde dehydrogenase
LFIKEIRKEIAVKAGQKCTAVRRIIVPSHLIDQVQHDLAAALDQTVFGDPRVDGVRMGALVNRGHLADVETAVAQLAGEMECVYRSEREPVGGDAERGAFMGPRLFRTDAPFAARACHEVEAFGPVATLMPYTEVEEAAALARKGRGSLCCSLTSHDHGEQRDFVLQAAPMHGRILVLDRDCAAESTGHGSPLPLLVHGGPGRAGGGEEMGGIRGVHHYMQRTAIQGSPSALTAITSQYQVGGAQTESEPHVFRKYFEDLAVGDTVTTAKHTVTEADIVNFANVSGDHFYAHVDATSLEGTVFERRVAHGYYILSKAAGLFVEPRKGPVLLNYGIEEARFTKPVYPGSTIGVRLTVREKVSQEQRDRDDIPKGIVKFLVDVYDETGETVALATILTMVRRRTPDAELA